MEAPEVFIGTSVSCDFEQNIWTFSFDGQFQVSAGEYAILKRADYHKLLAVALADDAPRQRAEPGLGDDVPCVKCGAALDTGLECTECGYDNYEAVTGKPFIPKPKEPR